MYKSLKQNVLDDILTLNTQIKLLLFSKQIHKSVVNSKTLYVYVMYTTIKINLKLNEKCKPISSFKLLGFIK